MTIIQEEKTGCGIASVANIAGLSYSEVKKTANSLGIFAEDKALFSDTLYIRRLLKYYGVETSEDEIPFKSWQSLPDCALLAVNHRKEDNFIFWHWVVFKRTKDFAIVQDSAVYLKNNDRTDFDSINPEWFIEIK